MHHVPFLLHSHAAAPMHSQPMRAVFALPDCPPHERHVRARTTSTAENNAVRRHLTMYATCTSRMAALTNTAWARAGAVVRNAPINSAHFDAHLTALFVASLLSMIHEVVLEVHKKNTHRKLSLPANSIVLEAFVVDI